MQVPVTNFTTPPDEGFGGGVYGENATVDFHKSQFIRNTAHAYGGGIMLRKSVLTMAHSDMTGNKASDDNVNGDGGSLMLYKSTVFLQRCLIADSYAYLCGGGMRAIFCNIMVVNSTMRNNKADICGGAMSINLAYAGDADALYNISLTHSNFSNNTASNGGSVDLGFVHQTAADDRASNKFARHSSYKPLMSAFKSAFTNNTASFGQQMALQGKDLRLKLTSSNLFLNMTAVRRKGCCVIGDYINADGVCELCPRHMFSLDGSHTEACRACPDHAKCEGGAVVLADTGFFNFGNLGTCHVDTVYR
jgi:hypothetical protein